MNADQIIEGWLQQDRERDQRRQANRDARRQGRDEQGGTE